MTCFQSLSTLEFQIDLTVGKNLHGWKNSRSIWQTINFLWRLARYQWPLCQDTFLWLQRHYLYRFSSRVNFFPPCGLFGTREYTLYLRKTEPRRRNCLSFKINHAEDKKSADIYGFDFLHFHFYGNRCMIRIGQLLIFLL